MIPMSEIKKVVNLNSMGAVIGCDLEGTIKLLAQESIMVEIVPAVFDYMQFGFEVHVKYMGATLSTGYGDMVWKALGSAMKNLMFGPCAILMVKNG